MTVFANEALYHVRAADATILGSRYVARWVPAIKAQAACIAADRPACQVGSGSHNPGSRLPL